MRAINIKPGYGSASSIPDDDRMMLSDCTGPRWRRSAPRSAAAAKRGDGIRR